MTDIKIFVSTRIDKNVQFIDNHLYVPVRCGACFDKKQHSPILGDNTGTNISAKRDSFCELTVLYWAWKNQKADYYGLCHYRRYLSFSAQEYDVIENDEHSNGCISEKSLSADIINKYKLTDTHSLEQLLRHTDAIFISPIELKKYGCSSNYEAMQKAPLWHNMQDVDTVLEIIKEKYPQMYKTAQDYMFNYGYSYLYNCFIMKKDTFNQYCSWLFDILFELEKRIDMSSYTQQMYRTPGTISERLTGIWALWMQQNNKKIKNLPLIYFDDIEQKEQNILPAFTTNNTVLGVSCSNEYVPYLSVYLQSIKEHSSSQNNYDILVFERNITPENKKILTLQLQQNNISLRFIDPIEIIKHYDLKFPSNYNLECYFRLSAPLLLKNYKKILFTDADLIFQADPAKLFQTDISGFPLAACKDLMWGLMLNLKNNRNWIKYAKEELQLNKPYDYFNTGVMLLNIEEFNKHNYSSKLLEKVSNKQYRILEQDGLNAFFQTNIKYLDTRWNFPTKHTDFKKNWDFMPFQSEIQYNKDQQNPYIIHYAGVYKPWFYSEELYAFVWWQYARKTPFYEEILQKLIDFRISQRKPQANTAEIQQLRKEFVQVHFPNINNRFAANEYNTKLLFVIEHPMRFKLKKSWYAIKKAFAFGKQYQKYNQKYQSLKTLLKDAKKLKKSFFKI